MKHMSEAELVFLEEVREKKKAASGVHHKTGKRGYVGTMRFPSDIMSRKEKYNYRRGSKVMTTNMFDEILRLEDFKKLEVQDQKNRMLHWRANYQTKEIIKAMGVGSGTYYKIAQELELPKAPRVDREPIKRKAKTKVSLQEAAEKFARETPMPELEMEPMNPPPPVQEIIVNGLHLIFNGTYKPELIQKQLTKFQLLLEDESDDFYIELKIVQKQPQN